MQTNGNDTVFCPTPSVPNMNLYGDILANGLTKRELISTVVLHGILGNRELQVCLIEDYVRKNLDNPEPGDPLGEAAVVMADGLIQALNKEQSNG